MHVDLLPRFKSISRQKLCYVSAADRKKYPHLESVMKGVIDWPLITKYYDENESLNVVERLNGVMDFIFFGKLGGIATNDTSEQELSVLCLHLLQVSMVYVNTLLIQEVLSDSRWRKLLTAADWHALSPLIHSHINPYGLFPLDMLDRLLISRATDDSISQKKDE